MATLGNTSNEGEASNNNNNNPVLDSTLAGMVEFFDDQRNRWNERGGIARVEVTDDMALERFQKFNPPKYNEKPGVEAAEK